MHYLSKFVRAVLVMHTLEVKQIADLFLRIMVIFGGFFFWLQRHEWLVGFDKKYDYLGEMIID